MDSLLANIPTLLGWGIVHVTRFEDWQLQAAPEVYGRFLPYWVGWLLLFLHHYGLGVLGGFLALRKWRHPQWNAFSAFMQLFGCTVILPYPLALLVAGFVHVNSACNLIPYVVVAPWWTAPTAIPAYVIFFALWIYRRLSARKQTTHPLP